MRQRHLIVILIFLIFFVISFLTNILGPLIPELITGFNLSVGLAGFLPFSFFVAYGILSIPAGLLIERYSHKTVLLLSFAVAFTGALLFSIWPGFYIALISLFMIGSGMAMLQVSINPLLREAGGESRFAFNSVLAQLFFGGASFLSPLLYSFLVRHVHAGSQSFWIQLLNTLVPENMKWVSLYWIFALVSLVMIGIISMVDFPKVVLRADERIEIKGVLGHLLGNRQVLFFFLGTFAYVGTEQGIANWISQFLQTYHGIDPATQGASTIAYFWGLLTLGCLLGLLLLRLFDSRKVLVAFSGAALVALACALLGSSQMALYAFPLTGLFASVMWSIIVSLALNSVTSHHGTFSGILCSGIAGGAILPLLIGGMAEITGLRYAMGLLCIPLGYILSIGLWARPLVSNQTVSGWRELVSMKKKEANLQ